MECMRALIESDRQVDGCFTTYHNALERMALKKDRYLNGAGAAPEPSPPPPAVREEPAAVGQASRPAVPDSLFAGKLKQALEPVGSKQEG